MSFFEKLFGGDKPNDAPVETPPVAQPTGTPGVPASAPVVIPGSGTAAKVEDPADTFSGYSKIFDPIDPKNAPKAFDVNSIHDLSKLPEALKEQNYLAGTPKEEIDAIVAGGEGAVAALGKMLNRALQVATAQAITASGELVKNGVAKSMPEVNSMISSQFRDQQIRDEIGTVNPLLTNPAFTPIVDSIRQTLQTKFPTASPKEIAGLTNEYFQQMGKVMNGGNSNPNAQSSAKPQETDWNNYMSL